MSLSLEADKPPAGPPPASAAQVARGTSDECLRRTARTPRVLVVDDEENVLNSLRRLLRRESYELVTAQSAREALEILEDRPAQLVVSDYRMPGMTGIELLRGIQSRWPDTVRIILSGYSEVSAIISAINEGAIYKFLSKPWNDEEVKLHIRRALEQYELEVENKRMARAIAEQNKRLLDLNEQLEQRATDTAAGLDSVQGLLDLVDAAVITVDRCGLIVGANRRANEIMSAEAGGLIGTPASNTLPPELCDALFARTKVGEHPSAGALEHHERSLQWRARPVGSAGDIRGTVLTVWETVE